MMGVRWKDDRAALEGSRYLAVLHISCLDPSYVMPHRLRLACGTIGLVWHKGKYGYLACGTKCYAFCVTSTQPSCE